MCFFIFDNKLWKVFVCFCLVLVLVLKGLVVSLVVYVWFCCWLNVNCWSISIFFCWYVVNFLCCFLCNNVNVFGVGEMDLLVWNLVVRRWLKGEDEE